MGAPEKVALVKQGRLIGERKSVWILGFLGPAVKGRRKDHSR